MELQQIIEQIKSEIKVNSDGLGFVSIRGAARLCGIDSTGLGKNLKTGADQNPSKLAEHLISKSFKGADQNRWCETGIPDMALSFILTYYAYKA